jgi:hypothetical protein
MLDKSVFAIQPFETGGTAAGGSSKAKRYKSLVIVIPQKVVKALGLSKSSILQLKVDELDSHKMSLEMLMPISRNNDDDGKETVFDN